MIRPSRVALAIRNPYLFLAKLYKFMKRRLYVNETLLLFEHKVKTEQKAPVEIRYASMENVSDILNFQPERYVRVFEEFLSLDDRGYFAYLDGKCVHRSWVKHTPQVVDLHPLLSMNLEENWAFIHYCETAPDARGKNIYPYVLTKIVDDFRGKKRILICVNEENTPSVKGVKKAGFQEKKRLKLLVILGIKIRPDRTSLDIF
jgi:ribosomal protein S18 acetylase RimI-like enzyme